MAEPQIDIAQLERNVKERNEKLQGFLIDQGWAVRTHPVEGGRRSILQWAIPLGELTLSDHRQPTVPDEKPLGLHLTNALWLDDALLYSAAWAHHADDAQWLIDRFFDARLDGHLWTAWDELSFSW